MYLSANQTSNDYLRVKWYFAIDNIFPLIIFTISKVDVAIKWFTIKCFRKYLIQAI